MALHLYITRFAVSQDAALKSRYMHFPQPVESKDLKLVLEKTLKTCLSTLDRQSQEEVKSMFNHVQAPFKTHTLPFSSDTIP